MSTDGITVVCRCGAKLQTPSAPDLMRSDCPDVLRTENGEAFIRCACGFIVMLAASQERPGVYRITARWAE